MAERTNVTLLLGAEGCSEQQDESWLREATEEEIAEVTKGLKQVPSNLDGTNRPYFWMTVTPEAPNWAWTHAATHLRCVRLNP